MQGFASRPLCLGLPHTRSHLLRHPMASRLMAGGSSFERQASHIYRQEEVRQLLAALEVQRSIETAAGD